MNIKNKLFMVLIGFAAILSVSLVAVMQWSIDRGMVEYVNQREVQALAPAIEALKLRYQQDGDWQRIAGKHRQFDRIIRQTLMGSEFSLPKPKPRMFNNNQGLERPKHRRGEPRHKKHNGKPPQKPDRKLQQRSDRENQDFKQPPLPEKRVSYALLNAQREYIVGDYPETKRYSYSKITVDNEIVGYFAISKRNKLTQGYELDFVEQQQGHLWWIALVLMLIVLAISLPFARHLISPIKALTKGMHKLTQGQYQQTLNLSRKDEFSQLARDFNELAQTLNENDSARKRWLANISHELRTPVAILKGELEAILDGVRALDIEQVKSAHQEVNHLQRLINDLHALTSADIGGMSYRKQSFDLLNFLALELPKLSNYLAAENYTFRPNLTQEKAIMFADKTRLSQLFENLINNCVKYAKTGNQVQFTLEVNNQENLAEIVIEDDGQGVESQHLEHLFEHLYRVDSSRNKKTGGTGLGLSICHHIVVAHQGDIWAEQSSLGGLAIYITLPLAQQ